MLKPTNLIWSKAGQHCTADCDNLFFQENSNITKAKSRFLISHDLENKFKKLPQKAIFQIAETRFGCGLNFLLTCQLWQKQNPKTTWLHFISFEKHPILKQDLILLYQNWPELSELSTLLLDQYPEPIAGFYKLDFPKHRISLYLTWGDITKTLPQIRATIDVWFENQSPPKKNPEQGQQHIGKQDIKAQKQKKPKAPWYHVPPSKKEKDAQDAIVIGAGIAGCSTAYALLKRGWNVTIIDQNNAPGEATSGNIVGISYPRLSANKTPVSDFNLQAFHYARQLASTLPHTDFTACGVLHLDLTPALANKHKNIAALYSVHQKAIHYLTPDSARKISGTELTTGGLFYAQGGALKPPYFCADLLNQYPDYCQHYFKTKIDTIKKIGSLWHVFDHSHRLIKTAPILIIANNQLLKKCVYTNWLPLRFTKGQTSYLHSTDESNSIKTVLCHKGYIAPAQNGKQVIGATFERTNHIDHSVVSDHDHQNNIRELNTYLPHLKIDKSHVYSGRVGYRATTPDRLPLIGPCPDYHWFQENYKTLKHGNAFISYPKAQYHQGLYLSLGYSSHGMTTAPLAGEIIASLITNDPLPITQDLLQEILPQRFIIRDLKRA